MNHHTSKSNHTRVHVHQKIPHTSSIVKRVLHTLNLACPRCTSQVLTAFLTLVTSPDFSRFSLLFHAVDMEAESHFVFPLCKVHSCCNLLSAPCLGLAIRAVNLNTSHATTFKA